MAAMIRTAVALTVLPLLLASPAGAVELAGPAHVLDANSIEIGGRPIKLYGIVAPNEGLVCRRGGAAWRCGQDASWALAERLERHWLVCDTVPPAEPEVSTAVCYLGGRNGIDVGGWMVEQGWAVADPAASDYAAEERTAERAGRGLWAGTFNLPRLKR